MRHRLSVPLLAVLLTSSLLAGIPIATAQGATSACSFPVSETDATGASVTVADRPERIVVLQPSAAQTVWELGAADRVVGAPVGPYTDFLEEIERKENVLNLDEFAVNQEAVVQLDADIVLAPSIVPEETVLSLREADQTVFKFGFGTSLESVADKTELTGRLIGTCAEAEETNRAYRSRIESVRSGTDPDHTPRALYYTDGFAAGSGTFIDEILTTAGAANVAADNGVEGYGEVNEEALVEWNPEVIVVPDERAGLPETPAFESTFAVRNDQIAVVNGNYVSQPAPRVALAVEDVAEAVADAEREREAAAAPDAGADGDVETDVDADETDGSPPEAADGQSGFGIGIALVAVLAGVFFARRR
ncbi:PGF-CTERM-anchored ABC transporter substrate-binding protein [Natronomonas sp. LN261]|uniref:PGF-CTERM-anchored ABC transporter substrate-binding protein n=1 Tax=Natronomonas sp. LN261 TaxID=2750669 RepID=UPI0015EEE7E3|nr:PGF-CTERM-anchored ABC transporter substrate-binding protein [Natronomonas sp. LN261]